MSELFSPCGHSSYWTTVYDSCMACRANKAESDRDKWKALAGELQSALQDKLTLDQQAVFDLAQAEAIEAAATKALTAYTKLVKGGE